jgi:hypothetical protein
MVKMTAERMRLLIDQAKRVIRAPQRATHFFPLTASPLYLKTPAVDKKGPTGGPI